MASALPLPSWVVLDPVVHDADKVLDPERRQRHEWAAIRCASKNAYGCGKHGQAAVEGMSLYVRLVDGRSDLSSALAIRVTDEAMQSVRAQIMLDGRCCDSPGKRLRFSSNVFAVDADLVVVWVSFDGGDYAYYLVYDLTDASLAMIPCLARPFETSFQMRPLPARTGAGAGDYALVIMARDTRLDPVEGHVVCLWPKTASTGRWQGRYPRFPPERPRHFTPKMTFLFEGKVYWADLTRGVLYCDVQDLLAGDGDEVDFGYVGLPADCCRSNPRNISEYLSMGPMETHRTIGGAGSSVKLVSIEESPDDYAPGDATLTVWTLDLARRCWSKDAVLTLRSLWAQDDFKQSGLPEEVPEWPFLRAEEDGALYFLVPEPRRRQWDPQLHHVGGVDMRSKRLLLSGRLSSRSHINEPVNLLPADAFKHLDSLVAGQENLKGPIKPVAL